MSFDCLCKKWKWVTFWWVWFPTHLFCVALPPTSAKEWIKFLTLCTSCSWLKSLPSLLLKIFHYRISNASTSRISEPLCGAVRGRTISRQGRKPKKLEKRRVLGAMHLLLTKRVWGIYLRVGNFHIFGEVAIAFQANFRMSGGFLHLQFDLYWRCRTCTWSRWGVRMGESTRLTVTIQVNKDVAQIKLIIPVYYRCSSSTLTPESTNCSLCLAYYNTINTKHMQASRYLFARSRPSGILQCAFEKEYAKEFYTRGGCE